MTNNLTKEYNAFIKNKETYVSLWEEKSIKNFFTNIFKQGIVTNNYIPISINNYINFVEKSSGRKVTHKAHNKNTDNIT